MADAYFLRGSYSISYFMPPTTLTVARTGLNYGALNWWFGDVGSGVSLYGTALGTITGTVAVYGAPNVPVVRRVRLHETKSGLIVGETWSNAAGIYTFKGLRVDYTYYAVSWDHTGVNAGVIADGITPT